MPPPTTLPPCSQADGVRTSKGLWTHSGERQGLYWEDSRERHTVRYRLLDAQGGCALVVRATLVASRQVSTTGGLEGPFRSAMPEGTNNELCFRATVVYMNRR